MANNAPTDKFPSLKVVDVTDPDDEATLPGHGAKFGLQGLRDATQELVRAVRDLQADMGTLTKAVEGFAFIPRIVHWLAAGVAVLAVAGLFVWFLK